MRELARRQLARGYLLANEVGSAKDRQQFASLLILAGSTRAATPNLVALPASVIIVQGRHPALPVAQK